MAGNNKYKNIDQKDFLRYLNGEMSDKQRHAFEREIQKDLFASDALDGFSRYGAEKVSGDLSRLESRLRKRVSGSRTMVWVRVAASVAVLLTIGTLYFTVFTDKVDLQSRRVADSEKVDPSVEKGLAEEIHSLTKDAEQEMDLPDDGDDTEFTAETDKGSDAKVQSEDFANENIPEERSGPESESLATAGTRTETETYSRDEVTAGIETVEETEPPEGEEILVETETLPEMESGITVEDEIILSEELSLPDESEIEIEHVAESLSYDTGSRAVAAKSKKESQAVGMVSPEASVAVQSYDTIFASPVGGKDSFDKYILDNILFPEGDQAISQGVVILIFSIDQDGRPVNIKVEKSPGDAFSQEAIRLLEGGPDWLPGRINDMPVFKNARAEINFRRGN